MATTTIKVTTEVRDQLNEIARARCATANTIVEELLRAWKRDERLRAVQDAMARTSPEDMESYRKEIEEWDRVYPPLEPEEW